MTKKATHEHTRRYNSRLVLRTIYENDQISRAQIARITHLTRPTVSDVVADWMEFGIVQEVGLAPSRGGRRAILLSVVDDSRHLIGLDLARKDFRGAVINLRGEIRHRVNLTLADSDGEAALRTVYELVDTLMQSATSPLLGIGIGTPGLVDADRGIIHQAVNLKWKNLPLRSLLQERYALPVYMANDCQVSALAEYTFGPDNIMKDLVVLHVGWGVGAGIVIDGKLLHGNPFGAGEIGHIKVTDHGERCQCGQVGCLQAVTSDLAMVRQVRAVAHKIPALLQRAYTPFVNGVTFDTVVALFNEGDETVSQIVHQVGQYLGIAVTYLVSILGGCRILLSGRIIALGPGLLNVVREEVQRRALPELAQNTEIDFASQGTDIVLRGASALLLHNELGLF
ncbi:MAG: ROK family transcriptional regulator [Anaerolineae bacterium]|nr:ROK family transcriptional regulator [Anaerolineae bacterium]